jgi:hypothetical protein
MQGLEAGATFAGIQQQQQARAMQMQAAQAEQERQQQMATAVDALLRNPNATRAEYDRVAVFMPEKQREGLINAFNARTAEQQGNDLRFAGQVEAALAGGNTAIAQQLITERAAAERNSGREDQARGYETWAQIAQTSPDALRVVVGNILATLPGGGAVLENIGRVGSERRANELAGPQLRTAEANAVTAGVNAEFARPLAVAGLGTAQANAVTAAAAAAVAPELARLNVVQTRTNIRNLESQIGDRAVRQRLDADRLALDTARTLGEIQDRNGRIPESAQKGINDAAVASSAAGQQARRLESLAADLTKAGGGFGALSTATEWLRRSTGNQNAMSELRQEYVRLRNGLAIQSLPPGPATDRDIQLALSGFPPENADSRTIASFLTGMAKLQKVSENVEKAKADWLANNRGSLGRASATFQAGDFAARQGETFPDFSARIVTQATRSPMARAIEQIPESSGPTAVRPAAPAGPSVREQADAILRGGR